MPCDSSLTGNNARRRKVYLFNRKISDRQLQGRVSKEQKVVVTPDRLSVVQQIANLLLGMVFTTPTSNELRKTLLNRSRS